MSGKLTPPTGHDTTRPTLLPRHLADLRQSGLSDAQIAACGFYSEADPKAVAQVLGWKGGTKTLGPGWVAPFLDRDGRPTGYCQFKPDRPRVGRNGKPRKYENPKGKPVRVFVPPGTRAALADPAADLLLTEGTKKGAKADQDGFPCLALVGVDGWSAPRRADASGKKIGQRQLMPDLAAVAWSGRRVVIVFDSDAVANRNVRRAERALAAALTAAGADVRVVRLPAGPAGEKVGLDDYLVAHGADALRALLTAAGPPSGPLDDPPDPQPDGPPELVVGPDEYRVNAAATRLLGGEPDLYQRGGLLVQVFDPEAGPDPVGRGRRPAEGPTVAELAEPLVRERLSRVARWVEVRRIKDGEVLVPVHPPAWCVSAVHRRRRWPGVRPLDALVPFPVVLPDGAVLTANGYHPAARLLACLTPGLAVAVPDRPTRADVAAATSVLLDVVADFPFLTRAHLAAWVAGLLTPLAWFLFDGPAPLFLIDKNVRGAGAGLLADVIALVLTGGRFPVMSYSSDREELRKKITALAVEGERLVLLDNLDGPVGNDVLDAALTADVWKDRLLGVNKTYRGPLHLTWYATGNNVQFRADSSRRVCHIRMESLDERPETRTGFRHPDLRRYAREHRGRLLSAALTILKGWLAAGRPTHNLAAWGSYEEWSGVVREAVVFAGLPDPGETREALQAAADRDAAAMRDVIAGLAALDPAGRGLTAAEVVARLKADPVPDELADARTGVEELCGKLCGRALGYKFRHFQRRNFGGRMIDKAGSDGHKTNRWTVRAVRRPAGANPCPGSPGSPDRPGPAAGDAGDPGHGASPQARHGGRLFGTGDGVTHTDIWDTIGH